jgi:hypothetical protein
MDLDKDWSRIDNHHTMLMPFNMWMDKAVVSDEFIEKETSIKS